MGLRLQLIADTLDGMKRPKWNTETRQAYADGARDRAKTMPDRRKQANRDACRKWRWN